MIPATVPRKGESAICGCTCATIATTTDPQAVLTDSLTSSAASEVEATSKDSYGQILKSSALVGGAQMANIAIGIVRTKAMAMLLGPAGFGLFGLYGSIQNLTQSIAGMGINSSGVRQIAEAAGTGDQMRIGQTTAVLRRTSIVLGLLGAALLVMFSRQVSRLTFGNSDRAGAVSLLSIAVLFGLVSAGQGAVIQGMRRIADLAKMNVLAALFGIFTAIPLVYFFREKGVVPSLVSVAAMTILTSWWYSRKIDIPPTSVTLSQVQEGAAALLKLGSAFMASGLMTMGAAYATRIILLRKVGFEATGLYQSAWTLGGLYVGFILQAMGADFYPRLTAQANDNAACNRLVNEQAQIGLLLAAPGVVATLTFASIVVALFYSSKFGAAVGVLRWVCLSVTLQVISWPMGFIIIAKGKSALFFGAELAWTIVAIGLAWACVESFGLNGAGIAFFGSYVFHCFLIYPIAHRLSNFRWSSANGVGCLLCLSLIAVVFCGFYVLPPLLAIAIGTLALGVSVTYSLRTLIKLIPLDRLPRQMRHLLCRFGAGRPVPATVS
jgi:O-antigen/teichoic acid export membrane protein